MRVFLTFLTLLLAGHNCNATLTFDGASLVIPGDEWHMLSADTPPPIDSLVAALDDYEWVPLAGNTDLGGIDTRFIRLDLKVTYAGNQRPLLFIPYAFIPNLKIGVSREGRLLMWQALHENMEVPEQSTKQSFGMVVLPIDAPGEYQILIQATAVANAVVVRGAKLHLDKNFILRDYPASVSTASAIMGALSTFLIFCFAVLFYRFRLEYVFALIFLFGAFSSILLREGVLFLTWDLEASWWVVHFLPLAIGMCNAGAMFFVCADFIHARKTWSWRLVKWAGIVALTIGLLNIVLPTRDNQYYSVPGFAFVILGTAVALIMVLARAWSGTLRERIFALFIAPYFAVSLMRFLGATMQATINIPVMPMYASFYMLGTFVFVEYLVVLTREYIDERALRTADKARVDLVNRFSHELRTPLNAVIGLADLMKNSPSQQGVESYARMIKSAGNTLLGLVDDILDFSKLGETGILLARHPIRLDKLLTDVIAGFIPQAMEKRIMPRVEMDPGVPFFLLGDDVRIKQIFGNLLNNAYKFSRPNEFVTVSIKRGAIDGKTIELLCSVADKGRGIVEEKQALIFEPYTQVNPEDSSQLRGTGLGLAICKLLIEQMGGEISVYSVKDEGTTFSFSLKLEIDPEAPNLDEIFKPLQGINVLIVSSKAAATDYLPSMFDHWGAIVDIAPRGVDARRDEYDLVLFESLYEPAEQESDWLNQLPARTVVEVIEIRPEGWVDKLTHPNVHRLMVPVPMLAMLGRFVSHLSGTTVDIGDERIDRIELHHPHHSVLLVDDNAVNLTVGSKLLESLGVTCEIAASGQLCLEKLSANPEAYTLILLDCEMPEINGFEVCTRWRREEQEKGLAPLPVVALTAHALAEVRDECLSVGMNEVVFKPIGREAMIELLNRYPDVRY